MLEDSAFDLSSIDPGVRDTVALLRAHGFDTTDSGDGSKAETMGCAFPFPNVAAVTGRAELLDEADRMAELLGPEWRVEASYNPGDGVYLLLALQPPKEER